jgi:alkanesulfonate monooxygenase SsuD/methylene tetrahydromethanopterin reductase-like flavin-dependent oxidoreductase (luciferase family)
VVQKSRFYSDRDTGERVASRRATLKTTPIEERIEKNLVLCGTPDQVVGQIKRMKEILGHGIMSINMKIGNIPDSVVRRSMELWRDHVAPEVRAL